MSLSMDVVNKVSHFAGNDMNLSPHLKNFLGKGEKWMVSGLYLILMLSLLHNVN